MSACLAKHSISTNEKKENKYKQRKRKKFCKRHIILSPLWSPKKRVTPQSNNQIEWTIVETNVGLANVVILMFFFQMSHQNSAKIDKIIFRDLDPLDIKKRTYK